MRDTNRSLWFAVLACMAMGFFAKSPSFVGSKTWITGVFFFATYILSGIGLWYGISGARKQKTWRSWLAPAINGFLILSFLAFSYLIYRALAQFQ